MNNRKIRNYKIRDILKFAKNKMYIFGESHFVDEDVNRIREAIIKIHPDFILHELADDDRIFYETHIPSSNVISLESDDIIKYIENNNKELDLKDKFKIREGSMLNNIQSFYNKDGIICVVVGDTHLRTIKTKELGDISPIYKWAIKQNDVSIIRSEYPEIK